MRQKVDLNELSEFMYDLEQNSFECDIYSVYKNFYSTFPYPGFLKWPEHPPKKVKNYLDSQREIFDQLADQHLEKIEQLILLRNNSLLTESSRIIFFSESLLLDLTISLKELERESI